MTRVRGNPAVVVSAHPVKNAGDDNLVPYGAGAILNEVDGNYTLAKQGKRIELHWQGKLRGLDFHPLSFQIETVTTRDVLDSKHRMIPLPVMVPVAAPSDDDKERAEKAMNESSRKLLLAMLDKPGQSLRVWAETSGISKSSVGDWLKKLKADKIVDDALGWTVTLKGQKAVGWKPVKEAENVSGSPGQDALLSVRPRVSRTGDGQEADIKDSGPLRADIH